MTRVVSLPPGPPSLELGRVTKSRAEIHLSESAANGSPIDSYKFEWTTDDDFGSLAQANARISCSDGSEVLGSFRFSYGNDNLSKISDTSAT